MLIAKQVRAASTAICRSVLLAHGGRIEADASPLGGLRIALTLPLTEDLS